MPEDPFVNRSGLYTKPIYTVTSAGPAAGFQGEIKWVTDLNSNPLTTAGQTATGGGINRGRIISDGTNWRVYGPNAS